MRVTCVAEIQTLASGTQELISCTAETQKLASDSEPETIFASDVEILVISMGADTERERMLKEDSISKGHRTQELQRAAEENTRSLQSATTLH